MVSIGHFYFAQIGHYHFAATLVNELTVASGRVVYDLNGITRERWDRLGNYQPQGEPFWDGSRGSGRPRAISRSK
jgi:hypothetical protein